MGVVNVTPDSFSDGGRYLDPEAAVAHAVSLVEDGADLLDIGGESTRPGAEPVPEEEELRRVVPVVRSLAGRAGVPISVDTSKAVVAAAALEAGATIVNDVSAGRADPGMLRLVAGAGAGLVVMHMAGNPRTMQRAPRYDDVTSEVGAFLAERLRVAREAGIRGDALCADPGIGFGKLVRHNLELLARLPELVAALEVPVLVGSSRKTFIGTIVAEALGVPAVLPPDRRDDGTLATVVWALDHGARVVRVHDVRSAAQAVRLLETMTSIDAEVVA